MEPLDKKAVLKQHERWCAMPKNAKQLEEEVYKISPDQAPNPPKKPKATLLNFFGSKK
jgi:hypothetical protein